MRLPLTRYGLPQVAVYPLLVFLAMAVCFIFLKDARVLIPAEIVLFLVFLWMLSFFRDPARTINNDETVLLSPADGTITDIALVDDSALDDVLGIVSGKGALRIGMFLSIFNVHINRVPCSVRIEKITYKKGEFKNAFSAEAGKINVSNDILMIRLGEPKDRLLVRQISGAIARHIVCEAAEGAEYAQGEQVGMIKFGSRTELYLSAGSGYEIAVKIGDKVQAGLTPLVRYTK
jgi:phosphatidylserine decarboxylase